jgi:heme/copper-type cytochrome/quinol oxidase subunit 2
MLTVRVEASIAPEQPPTKPDRHFVVVVFVVVIVVVVIVNVVNVVLLYQDSPQLAAKAPQPHPSSIATQIYASPLMPVRRRWVEMQPRVMQLPEDLPQIVW